MQSTIYLCMLQNDVPFFTCIWGCCLENIWWRSLRPMWCPCFCIPLPLLWKLCGEGLGGCEYTTTPYTRKSTNKLTKIFILNLILNFIHQYINRKLGHSVQLTCHVLHCISFINTPVLCPYFNTFRIHQFKVYLYSAIIMIPV